VTDGSGHALESVAPTVYRAYERLLRVVAMHPGEGRRALLTFLYLFLVIAAYLLIKTIRNALFISEFGAVKLPYVMLGVPLAAALFAMIYVRLARRFAAPWLIFWTLVFFISNMLFFWLLASPDRAWLSPVFYVWSGAYGVIATMQVWTLANELFTTREAKRLFGIIGAGGILGGVAGAYLAGSLAVAVGTVNLMLVVAGLLLVAALIVLALSRFRAVRTGRPADRPFARNLAGSLRLISGNGHLKLLAALVFISALATSSADFQFNMIADRAIDQQDQLTEFFGTVYAKINIVAFLLQLLLTSRILAHLGIGFSILLLPLALVSGTTALLLTQTTWAGLLLKGSDGAFKHSIDRSARELMYLPVPSRLKAQTKPAIDTAIERMGDGSAGALQLLLIAVMGLGLAGSLVANFAVLGIWILLAVRLKREYVNQLRSAMGQAPLGYAWRSPIAAEADASRTLSQVLRTESEPARLAALEWIRTSAAPVDQALLLERVQEDDSPAVRRTALALMLRDDDVEFPPELMGWLESEGQSALTAAIDLMTAPDAAERRQKLEALLDTAGETTRLSLVASLLRRLGPEFSPFAERMFDELLSPDAPSDSRCAAVRALALLPRGGGLQRRLARSG
jgi:AAA family ATP:ADP antiporter